ncbi:MAG: hypothetical protein NT149_02575 [Candidatus Gottesmanbacteria bacterium]|nr:hypothetical protein [Candidatus Gottesmanbacteria bacterium]
MVSIVLLLFFATICILGVFSYGFVDPNLVLSTNQLFLRLQEPLKNLAYHQRPIAMILFFAILIGLFACYGIFLKHGAKIFASWKHICVVLAASSVILAFSYPALTYDLFNYIMTAKVTYQYHENPYIVMPIEIPNEPNLAFTRAANKVALYGPVWILITAIPHYAGGGSVWLTVIAFKLLNAAVYVSFSYFIWRMTKNLTNVIFFALNPLVLIEVIMNGHNDIYMMAFALFGLFLWSRKRFTQKIGGFILLIASWLVKGATVALAPLVLFRRVSFERILIYAYIFLAAVFFIVAPIREELYPWYAVWLIATASLLPLKNHRYIFGFTIVLSFALELRALPYMWMGYYEGPGPIFRVLLTVLPVAFYLLFFAFKRLRKSMYEK